MVSVHSFLLFHGSFISMAGENAEMCRVSAELLTLCVDSEKGGPVCKPCLDLLHPGQVCHEGWSGAGAKVDDKRLPRPGYTEQGHLVPSDRVVQHRVRGRAVQGGYLQGLCYQFSIGTSVRRSSGRRSGVAVQAVDCWQ